jgi:prepilin peptidase CpaA
VTANREWVVHSAFLTAAVGILVIVAYEDVRWRRIPNALSLATAALGLARVAFAADVIDAGYTLAVAVIIFTITFALFQRGAIGGGDAKILPAAALLIGHRELLGFLFLMSLCGGVLALATLAAERLDLSFRRFRREAYVSSTGQSDRARVASKGSTVPYGVAVAIAGVITLIAAR